MATLEEFYKYTGSPAQLEIFEELFNVLGSDKATRHNYHEIYSALFPYPNEVKSILEIGIYHGGSLRAWESLFPQADILGLDINPDFFFEEGRIKSMFVDQSKLRTFYDVHKATGRKTYDFIVDDGCHEPNETLLTFNATLLG